MFGKSSLKSLIDTSQGWTFITVKLVFDRTVVLKVKIGSNVSKTVNKKVNKATA